jgi:hypothetical protein
MAFLEGVSLPRVSFEGSLHRLKRIADYNYDTLEEVVARVDAEIRASEQRLPESTPFTPPQLIPRIETHNMPEQILFQSQDIPLPEAA